MPLRDPSVGVPSSKSAEDELIDRQRQVGIRLERAGRVPGKRHEHQQQPITDQHAAVNADLPDNARR